jgi:cell division protein ZipA
MMEQLSIRDWMVILGGVMIAAVLVDAGRRRWRERRAEIRLNARIDRSKSGSNDDDTFNLLTELPNGGARIVRRDDLDAGDLDAGNLEPASIAEAPATPADAVEERVRKFPAAPDPIDVAVQSDDPDEVPSHVEAPAEVNEPAPAMSASPRRRRTVKPPGDPSTAEARDVSAEGTVDWLDTLEPNEVSETDSVEQGRLPRGANTHVFILYVVARSEGWIYWNPCWPAICALAIWIFFIGMSWHLEEAR